MIKFKVLLRVAKPLLMFVIFSTPAWASDFLVSVPMKSAKKGEFKFAAKLSDVVEAQDLASKISYFLAQPAEPLNKKNPNPKTCWICSEILSADKLHTLGTANQIVSPGAGDDTELSLAFVGTAAAGHFLTADEAGLVSVTFYGAEAHPFDLPPSYRSDKVLRIPLKSIKGLVEKELPGQKITINFVFKEEAPAAKRKELSFDFRLAPGTVPYAIGAEKFGFWIPTLLFSADSSSQKDIQFKPMLVALAWGQRCYPEDGQNFLSNAQAWYWGHSIYLSLAGQQWLDLFAGNTQFGLSRFNVGYLLDVNNFGYIGLGLDIDLHTNNDWQAGKRGTFSVGISPGFLQFFKAAN